MVLSHWPFEGPILRKRCAFLRARQALQEASLSSMTTRRDIYTHGRYKKSLRRGEQLALCAPYPFKRVVPRFPIKNSAGETVRRINMTPFYMLSSFSMVVLRALIRHSGSWGMFHRSGILFVRSLCQPSIPNRFPTVLTIQGSFRPQSVPRTRDRLGSPPYGRCPHLSSMRPDFPPKQGRVCAPGGAIDAADVTPNRPSRTSHEVGLHWGRHQHGVEEAL